MIDKKIDIQITIKELTDLLFSTRASLYKNESVEMQKRIFSIHTKLRKILNPYSGEGR